MGRVVHFEIAVDDMERAREFYRKAFGWTAEVWHGPCDYVLLITGAQEPGIEGALIRRESETPSTTVTMDGASVDEAISNTTAAGGNLVTQVDDPRRRLSGLLRGHGGQPL